MMPGAPPRGGGQPALPERVLGYAAPTVRAGLLAVIEPLVPGPLRVDAEGLLAARMLLGAVLLAFAVAIVTGGCFWVLGLTYFAGLTFAYGGVLAAVPLYLRLRPEVRSGTHLAIGLTCLYLASGTLTLTPVDLGQALWLAALPIVALLALGRAAGLLWLAIVTLVGAALSVFAFSGWSMGQVASHPLLPSVFRLFTFVPAMAGLAFVFDAARRTAMDEATLARANLEEERAEAEVARAEAEAARAEAERASRAKSQFLANISHELRTPMNAVIGLTDALLTEELTATQREQLELLERSGRAMVALIGDLLDITKIEAGQLELEVSTFDLGQLLSDVGALFRPTALSKGLELVVEVADDVPRWVLGDPLRTRQILANLVGNATKFTEAGKVRLAARALGGARVEVTIADTGIGIPAELVPKLFEKFFQADVSHTRRYGGTGLGLAIARELAEMMGGGIEVESAAGAGTLMRVTLTLPAAEAPPARATHDPRARPRLSPGLPVLVVDDNAVNRTVASLLLKRLGLSVELAEDGREALARFAPGRYRAILMDVQMPELDGYETTRAIRDREVGAARTPILGLTASALASTLTRCLEAGMDRCLTKPVTLDGLASALGALEGEVPGSP